VVEFEVLSRLCLETLSKITETLIRIAMTMTILTGVRALLQSIQANVETLTRLETFPSKYLSINHVGLSVSLLSHR
jgi:hypothetical protein